MKEKRKTKLWIGIGVGVAISIITLVALGLILMLLFLFGGPTEISTGITNYEEVMNKYPYVQTGFITFPETIPDSVTDEDFYFSFKDTWDDPTCEVFLQCTYDEADYQKEVERLEHTKKQYGSVKRMLSRGEEGRFQYPVYIAIDAHNHAYEYALLTGDRQITYIYTSFMSKGDLKKIEEKYLPFDYDSRREQTKVGEGYTIYLVGDITDNGKVLGRRLDYSRDAVVEVQNSHVVEIGYNSFAVYTCLDEEDNEIIQYCAFVYYEGKHDYYNGLPDEIPYRELSGYRFKAVELNEAMTIATVTYYDGEEEMTKEYEIPQTE